MKHATTTPYRSFLPILFVLAALASGCATVSEPALKAGDATVDVSKEALLFMTARVSNQLKPDYQPRILTVFIQSESGKEMLSMKADLPYDKSATYQEALLSFRLAPGRYRIRDVLALYQGFPIMGTFSMPIHQTIEVKGPGVYYLGRIEGTVVERKLDSELRAGPVIPLIDQRVAGASGGTFQVKIEDKLDQDLRVLGPRYPVLTKLSVTKSLLKPWKQPTEAEMEPLK